MAKALNHEPAFPVNWMDFQPGTGEQVVRVQYVGMEMRDLFAAVAMHALMRNQTTFEPGLNVTRADVAVEAYRQADAMMELRTLEHNAEQAEQK